jgi:hypothetical protein
MIVFAGSEGRWKYDDGTFELLIPNKPVFGALDIEVAWSCLRCCCIRRVGMAEALATGRNRVPIVDGIADVMLLLSIGPFNTMRDATSDAILLFF